MLLGLILFLLAMGNTTNSRLIALQSQVGHPFTNSISPLGRWLNGTIIAADYGSLTIDFTIREEFTNPAGVLHGGAAAAMLDDAIGTIVFALGREFAYTSVNLSLDFLHAAQKGEVIRVFADVGRAGKNIIYCEGRIVAADGKVIAKCTTNLIQTSVKMNV